MLKRSQACASEPALILWRSPGTRALPARSPFLSCASSRRRSPASPKMQRASFTSVLPARTRSTPRSRAASRRRVHARCACSVTLAMRRQSSPAGTPTRLRWRALCSSRQRLCPSAGKRRCGSRRWPARLPISARPQLKRARFSSVGPAARFPHSAPRAPRSPIAWPGTCNCRTPSPGTAPATASPGWVAKPRSSPAWRRRSRATWRCSEHAAQA